MEIQNKDSDLWKLCKDHDCHYYINREEFYTFFRSFDSAYPIYDQIESINNKKSKKFRQDLKYEDFCTFFLHFSEFFFSRNPFDKSAYPLGHLLEQLIDHFRSARLAKGDRVAIFEEVEQGFTKNHNYNPEIIELNEFLEENPDAEIPKVIIIQIIIKRKLC